jgi:hypothetical protein
MIRRAATRAAVVRRIADLLSVGVHGGRYLAARIRGKLGVKWFLWTCSKLARPSRAEPGLTARLVPTNLPGLADLLILDSSGDVVERYGDRTLRQVLGILASSTTESQLMIRRAAASLVA